MAITIDGNNTPTLGGVGYGDGTELAFTGAGTAGGVLYSAGGAAPVFSAAGTSGQVLTSGGAGAPTWVNAAGITLGTPVNTTSGTSIDITGIPSGVKQITVMFSIVSLLTSDSAIIQLGDSGGIETASYLGSYTRASAGVSSGFTSGFIVFDSTNNAFTYNGLLILNLQNSSTNTWAGSSLLAMSNASSIATGAGTKSLSGVIDRIRLTTITGGVAFDAGQINISYA